MTSYNRILIAVDLTSDSAHVIARAREIGAHYAAELNLVHVIEPIPVVYMLDSIGTDYSALYAEATRQSRDTLLQLGGAEGIPVEPVCIT